MTLDDFLKQLKETIDVCGCDDGRVWEETKTGRGWRPCPECSKARQAYAAVTAFIAAQNEVEA